MVQQRKTIPQELDDPEDICVNQESFEEIDDDDENDGEEASVGDIKREGSETTSSPVYIMQQIHQLPKEARNLLAGGMAGMVAKSVVAPLDRIKIMYQVTNVPFHFRSIPQVMQRIAKTEGVDALWKGNVATMIRVFPYSGIQFMTYDRIKSFFLQRHEHNKYLTIDHASIEKHGLTPVESLVAGMTAGMCSVICTYPLDLTRAQLAVLKKHKRQEHVPNKSFVSVLTDNYVQRGLRGLFRGITPTIIGILPYSGIAFTLNEQGKREIAHVTGRDLTTIERMICGAFAGLVAQTVTYPLEVTRRRMQTLGVVGNDTAFASLRETEKASSIRLPIAPTAIMAKPPTLGSTIRFLYNEQGIRGFFKGVTMNWIKGPVAFSISFTSYDTMQALFLSKQERSMKFPLRKRVTRPAK